MENGKKVIGSVVEASTVKSSVLRETLVPITLNSYPPSKKKKGDILSVTTW